MSLSSTSATKPGDHIRSMYEKMREHAQKAHDDMLDMIIEKGLSDEAFAALYAKAANDFKTRLVHKTYDVILYFSLERLFDYAKYSLLDNKGAFYVLDAENELINFNETAHLQRSGLGAQPGRHCDTIRDRWEKYYKNHPKFVAVGEKLAELFPGWKIGAPHMRWYEPSGYPQVCFTVSCDL